MYYYGIKPVTKSRLAKYKSEMHPEEKMKILLFETDDDFTSFCLKPDYVILSSEDGGVCSDIEFTDEYLKAVETGVKFCIKAETSTIRNRGVVQKGVLSKPVENVIDEWEDDFIKALYPKAELMDYGKEKTIR